MSKELLVIENVELVPFFTKGEAVDETLAKIEAEALAFVAGDLSVKKNRDAVKAMVTKVTKSKTYLEKHGKELAAEYKLIPKQIDSQRKKVKDHLTELAEKVRAGLTEWEEEQKRIAAEEAEAERLQKIADEIAFMWEFAWTENEAFDKAKEDARLAEIERQRLHDEEVARKATEAAEEKAKAEIKAAKDREEAQRKAAIQAEIDAQLAEERRIAQKEEADRQAKIAEQQRIDREKQMAIEAEQRAEQAELDRIENERQAKIQAEQAAEQARLNEIARQEAVAKAERDRLATLEANKAHKGKIYKQSKECLMSECGLTEEQAKAVVKAIASKKIANCTVNY